jgi:hypothetical protein
MLNTTVTTLNETIVDTYFNASGYSLSASMTTNYYATTVTAINGGAGAGAGAYGSAGSGIISSSMSVWSYTIPG